MFPKTALIRRLKVLILAALALALLAPLGRAQSSSSQNSSSQQNPPSNPQEGAPSAGGPEGDVGTIAVPKKKEEAPKVEKKEKFKQPAGLPDYSLRVDVPSVNVDVLVTTKDGGFVPGLRPENFRILEDGVPQKVTSFNQSEAPITAVLLVEFAHTSYYFIDDMLNASYSFTQMLKPQDWVAVVSYDMRTKILTDFTQDKRQVYGALGTMRIPGFSETNLFDALYDTLDRLERIEGHKYIILVASGVDTFSKHTLDDAYKKVKATPDVTIYTISTGGFVRTLAENRGMSPITNLTYLQADNQMASFAKQTGGVAFKPRFPAEFPEVFRAIGATIRNQYSLTYHPTNTAQDGSYRKIKVELVDPSSGGRLKVVNEKGKEVKYQIIARDGYNAKHQVE
ncbi:MAG TPA: VWA domain-containing protein [Terriglobales bacterium]|nr:VWA domain-containing protein [Terriglobales bacterium]